MSLIKDKIELDVQLAELRTKQALDSFPTVFRWILVISIMATVPGYFIAKGVSYRATVKAYQKNIIVAKASFQNPKEPKVSTVFLTSSGNGNFSAGVAISNQNVDLSLALADYEFTFQNSKGELLYKDNGQLFLLPNENKYAVVPRFASKDEVANASFRFTKPLRWQKKISIPKIDIQTSEPAFYNQFQPPAFVITGNYYNNSPYQLKQVRLTFLVYDKSNSIVAISRRDDFTLAPFERRTYQQLWPNIYGDPGSRIQVFAETNPLDPSNISLPQAPDNSASDLNRPSEENN